jgi:hypothetical protein
MTVHAMGAQGGDSLQPGDAVAVPSGEGRWPRICERWCASMALAVRCNYVL